MGVDSQIETSLRSVRQSNRQLRKLSASQKDPFLMKLAANLESHAAEILAQNQVDLKNLAADTSSAFRDRLTLNLQRISLMAESLRQVAKLPDPVGEIVEQKTLSTGLQVKRVRAPLGVLLMIFESRPNVILEAFSLAFKSGNSIILRGGSDSNATAKVIYRILRETLKANGLSQDFFYGIEDYDRGLVENLLKRKDLIDVVIPRGGDKLIEFVQKTSLMPIIKNDRGLCHTFVDNSADLEMAVQIVSNAKTQRPGVCNALETLLVHRNCASQFLPKIYEATRSVGLQWHVDTESLAILTGKGGVQIASSSDWDTEYLDLIMNCRIVSDLDEAIEHIEAHGSHHSEAIITESEENARRFESEVDAAAVYWNASTRFTDGFELGLGGELGISTQKLHVRGPVGLRELTTPRWIIEGNGQIRV